MVSCEAARLLVGRPPLTMRFELTEYKDSLYPRHCHQKSSLHVRWRALCLDTPYCPAKSNLRFCYHQQVNAVAECNASQTQCAMEKVWRREWMVGGGRVCCV